MDSSETSSGDVIYDYIVIGSGPGGTGFIYKLLSLHPEATIIWFKEGDLIEAGEVDQGDGLVQARARRLN